MFLKRIQVPDFRVLKDVDITFEPEFSPRIFPLGSLNGGGKSTLLQLVFVLLSCSADPEKHYFIQNLLEEFEIEKNDSKKLIAKFHITDHNKTVEILFVAAKETHIDSIVRSTNILEKHIRYMFDELELVEEKQEEYHRLDEYINQLESSNYDRYTDLEIEHLENKIVACKTSLKDIHKQYSFKNEKLEKIFSILENINKKHICICNKQDNRFALLCEVKSSRDNIKISDVLSKISRKIYLAAPSTQIFLFASRESRKTLFKSFAKQNWYHTLLDNVRSKLPNFYTYEISTVDFIIEYFKSARDKDFKKAIETGEYGDAYKSIVKDLNSLLGNKKINIDTDLSGVNFKIERNGELKELYPEDLSHGELKRLSIYVWLKYKRIEDSIVLIDEIENALHPDWQYKIISDLAKWGKTNQYILATHSYELCQALTPAHVKELEPKLITEN